MGYRVPKTDYGIGWKLKIESYKGGKRVNRDIPRDEWGRLGFHPRMTWDEAKAHAKKLNAQGELTRLEQRRSVIQARLDEEELVLSAYLPPTETAEFEQQVLFGREVFDTKDATRRKKLESHWRAVKKCLNHLRLDPAEWGAQPERFYDYFAKHQISPSYAQKMLRILNLWGKFQARKQQRYFEPLKAPRGREKNRIADRYFDKNEEGMASAPLTPKVLEAERGSLQPAQFNWLYLTVWFGLRPEEADNARSAEILQDNELQVPVLRVYQPKLVNLPRKDRYKFIPCIYPEQKAGLDLVLNGPIKRPLLKTIHDRFGPKVHLYGGRKGFEDLMLKRGHPYSDISAWMGHQTVDRTWRNYRNRQSVRFTKAA